MTNSEKIRKEMGIKMMSDDYLAFHLSHSHCPDTMGDEAHRSCPENLTCHDCWMHWLQMEESDDCRLPWLTKEVLDDCQVS